MSAPDVVIKHSLPLRIVEASAIAPGPGPANVGPIFQRLIPQVLGVLHRNGVQPGMSVGHYADLPDDGGLLVHVGFEIAPHASIAERDDAAVADLPVVSVASLMHHGSLETLLESYQRLAHWVRDSGYTMSGPTRELYLRYSEDDPSGNITELQALLTAGPPELLRPSEA